jgi:pyruvate dehydrogenase E1 component beta subunit
MSVDERVVVLGEDVVSTGGIWGATTGLAESFGDRVVDTPLTEQGIVGAAIGMALAGLHPVVEIQFGGFVLTAIDQWHGHAARYAARSGGRLRVPLVLRMPAGAGHGGYEGHNESFDLLHVSAPGLQVCAPTTPREAYVLTRRALATQGPVVVLEPTADYLRDAWGDDADGLSLAADDGSVPSWGSSVLRARGDAVTVVSYGSATRIAEQAAAALVAEGVQIDLLDLHDLMPFDVEAVLASLRRTGRLIVVQDAPIRAGLGATVIGAVAERDPHLFAVPPVRVAQPDVPYGPALLEPVTAVVPEDVVAAVHRLRG